MEQMQPSPQIDQERINQYTRILSGTIPKGEDDWYNKMRQLLGKELSLANLEKEDISSYLRRIQTAQTLVLHGYEIRGRRIMLELISELKLTGSVGGLILEHIFSNRVQYEQTQHIHEHSEQPQKRGLLGRRMN